MDGKTIFFIIAIIAAYAAGAYSHHRDADAMCALDLVPQAWVERAIHAYNRCVASFEGATQADCMLYAEIVVRR